MTAYWIHRLDGEVRKNDQKYVLIARKSKRDYKYVRLLTTTSGR